MVHARRLLILVYPETYLMKTTTFLMEAKFLSNGQHLKPYTIENTPRLVMCGAMGAYSMRSGPSE